MPVTPAAAVGNSRRRAADSVAVVAPEVPRPDRSLELGPDSLLAWPDEPDFLVPMEVPVPELHVDSVLDFLRILH